MHQSTMLEKKDSQTNNLQNANFYFLECLKRKNSITTEFYINIHTSILTFKQFYKLAHQCKQKTPDPAIPVNNPSKFLVINQTKRPSCLTWTKRLFTQAKS
jgi:hypothetical protein